MNKIFLLLALIGVFIVGCEVQQETFSGTSGGIVPVGEGRLVLGITDDVELGTITELNIMIDTIVLHNVDGQKITLQVNKEFNLIELNKQNIIEELGDIRIPQGTYNLLVMNINKVTGIIDDKQEDIILPSNSLRMPVNIIVDADKTSAIVLDFLADKSLHRTGKEKIIMAPVINLNTKRDVEVTKDVKGLKFGKAVSEEAKKIGTDIRGVVGENKRITKEDIDNIVVDRIGKIRQIVRHNVQNKVS